MKKIFILVMVYSIVLFGNTFIKYYGSSDSDDLESGLDVIKTTDSCYVVVGGYDVWDYISGTPNEQNIVLLKITNEGELLWYRIYPIENIGTSWNGGVIETADKGFLICGNEHTLMKTDSLGIEEWRKNIYSEASTYSVNGYEIIKTNDNNYLIAGYPSLLKIDPAGDIIWECENIDCTDVLQTNAGDILVTRNFITDTLKTYVHDIEIIKINSNGSVVWRKSFGGSGDDNASAILQTNDSGFVLVGSTKSIVPGESDVLCIKIDSNGNKVWENTYGTDEYEFGFSIISASDGTGDFLIGGRQNEPSIGMFIIRINEFGNLIWSETIENTYQCNDIEYAYGQDGGYVLTGGISNIVVVKTDKNGMTSINNDHFTVSIFELLQNYPNPFNPVTTIIYSLMDDAQVNLKVYDIAGRQVCTLVDSKQKQGSHEVNFDGSMLTSGIYFYSLSIDGKAVENRKMMLLK